MTVGAAAPRRAVMVSVVMPCFNAGPFLAEAVASVLGQSYPHLELIVVDDGSTDGSFEYVAPLAAAMPDRLQLHRQPHQGAFRARNAALARARGDLVAFLDADDYWRSDFLERMVAALRCAGADVAYCGWQNVHEGAPATAPYVPPPYEAGDPVDAFLQSCPWPIHAALTRRSVLESIGRFSERRSSAMDYDLWLRLLGCTQRFVRVPEVMAFYRWHGQAQISSVKWRQVLDAREARRAFIRDHAPLVAHLSPERLRDLTEGTVRREAYGALWRRDAVSARRLFRHMGWAGAFRPRDAGYVVAAMLPLPLYLLLLRCLDRGAQGHV